MYVTGSNAHMLSREIASTLGGRYQIREVFPFSFTDYLKWHGIEIENNWEYSSVRQNIRRLFDDYFYYGGIAEIFPLNDKRGWLTALYQKVLYSDVAIRNKVRNERGLNLLVKKLADSVLQPTSVKRMQDTLTGIGHKVTRDTITNFLQYLHDAYIVFPVSNFTDGAKEREGNRKHYFYDNGILNLFLFQPETKLLENIVALTLIKLYGEEAVFYYKRNAEVDFYVPSQSVAIQVAYDLELQATKDREVGNLIALTSYINTVEKLMIITMDTEDTIRQGNLLIEVIPVWKWLMQLNSKDIKC